MKTCKDCKWMVRYTGSPDSEKWCCALDGYPEKYEDMEYIECKDFKPKEFPLPPTIPGPRQ